MRSNKNRCSKHWKHTRKHMQNTIRTATKSKNIEHEQNTNLARAMYCTSTLSSRIHVQTDHPYTQAYQKTSHPRYILKKKRCQTLPMQEIRKKIHINWKGYDKWPDKLTDPDRPYMAVCVRACVRACKQARQNNFPVELTPPTSDISSILKHNNIFKICSPTSNFPQKTKTNVTQWTNCIKPTATH